jgi:sialic acid synthase
MKIQLSHNIKIGEDEPCFIIAEAGINHGGSLDKAKELIDKAVESGAHCVKFQKRTIERILTKEGLDMTYNGVNSFGNTYGEHKSALEFSKPDFAELKLYADKLDILFTASGWDEESVDFLDSLNVPFFKVASADLTNIPLLIHTAQKGKPIILSTGMSDLAMVKTAYSQVKLYNDQIIILQCTSTYPCPDDEVHLNVMQTYSHIFPDTIIGYSGHEKGIAISLAAVALGAKVIERHYTTDRTLKGSDHAASLEVPGLKKLVRDIKIIESSFGSSVKTIQESEHGCMKKLRKSIVTTCKIPTGVVITREMLTTKGPGTGISPAKMPYIVGSVSLTDLDEDIVIKEENIIQIHK